MKNLLLICVLFYPVIIFAEGQYGFDVIMNTIYFFVVLVVTIVILIGLYVFAKKHNQAITTKKAKITFFLVGISLGILVWQLTKYNPKNTVQYGHVDHSDWKVEYQFSQPRGAYYYLNGERKFLRELTKEEAATTIIDSTLSIPIIDSLKSHSDR